MSSVAHTKPSSHRKHRTRAQWQTILQQFAASGLSAPQFCKKKHLSYPGFCKWRGQLRTEGAMPLSAQHAAALPLPAFIEMSNAGVVDPAPAGAWHIVLKLGGGVELCLSQR